MSRTNESGEIVYTYPQEEGIGLYINPTNSCSNRCVFCLSNFYDALQGSKLKLDRDPSYNELEKGITKKLNEGDINEIVFCGLGEPLKRLDDIVLPLSSKLKEFYPDIPIRVDTNGQAGLLYPERENVPEELFIAGVDEVSVSLNAENSGKYYALCNPQFPGKHPEEIYADVLNFISQSSEAGLKTRATALEFALDNLPVELHPDLDKTEEIARYVGAHEFKIRTYKGPDLRPYFNKIKIKKLIEVKNERNLLPTNQHF